MCFFQRTILIRLQGKCLSNMKKLLKERRDVIENLRKVARDLGQLHDTINKVKVGGDVASCIGGSLLMLGGGALEVISAGTATPIAAAMENCRIVAHCRRCCRLSRR